MSPTDQLVLQQMVPSSARFTLLLVERLRLAAPSIMKELNLFKVAIEDLDRSMMMDILVTADETTNANVDRDAVVQMNMEQATETWRSIVTDMKWNPECKDFIFTVSEDNSEISSRLNADDKTVKMNINDIKNGTIILVDEKWFKVVKQIVYEQESLNRLWLDSQSKKMEPINVPDERENSDSKTDIFGKQFDTRKLNNEINGKEALGYENQLNLNENSTIDKMAKIQEVRKKRIDSLLNQIRTRIHDMVIKHHEIENLKAQVKRLVIGYHDKLSVANESPVISSTKQTIENRRHFQKQEEITQQALEADLKNQMNDWTSESRFFDQSSDVNAKSYSLSQTNQNTKSEKFTPDEKKLPSNSMQKIEKESVEQANNDNCSSNPSPRKPVSMRSENILSKSNRKNCQYQKSPKSDRRCWICNGVGHQKKNCPSNKRSRKNEKKPEKRNKSIQCFNCNEFGHFARNCPLADRINDNSSPVETRG